MDVCSLKLASDFTCMTFSVAAFFFIQLWWRRVWEAQEGEEYWAAAVFCLISCPTKISHPTEMALLWIKEWVP